MPSTVHHALNISLLWSYMIIIKLINRELFVLALRSVSVFSSRDDCGMSKEVCLKGLNFPSIKKEPVSRLFIHPKRIIIFSSVLI